MPKVRVWGTVFAIGLGGNFRALRRRITANLIGGPAPSAPLLALSHRQQRTWRNRHRVSRQREAQNMGPANRGGAGRGVPLGYILDAPDIVL
ncbi:MAG: hypothetical protein ACREDT_00230 [Methylocella sp.]